MANKKQKQYLDIFKNRKQILEGIKNNIIKKEDIEIVASNRMNKCLQCPSMILCSIFFKRELELVRVSHGI